MELDASGWSGDGAFTELLVAALEGTPAIRFVRVEDAPASRGDAGFSFISNEVFIGFATIERKRRVRRLGIFPGVTRTVEKALTLEGLAEILSAADGIGPPDYADEGMIQYLRAERIVPPYQTRGYKLVELVRIYEVGSPPRREP